MVAYSDKSGRIFPNRIDMDKLGTLGIFVQTAEGGSFASLHAKRAA